MPHYTLTEVDIHYSFTDEFSQYRVFQDNIKKDARLIWKAK